MAFHALFTLATAAAEAADCASFAASIKLDRPNVNVSATTHVAAYLLNISDGRSGFLLNTVPFCQIQGAVPYSGNKSINFELSLPERANYTGRYMSVGNSGMVGSIDTFSMLPQVEAGFAVAGGDSGHIAALSNAGAGAPDTYLPYLHSRDETLDWIHNSVADFTVVTKKLVEQYFSNTPSYSYYYGCSTGGAQGFALAQLHPDLFDGIYAGCPRAYYSHLALSFLWNGDVTAGDGYMDAATLARITDAALAQCDALDGVTDGLIENPLICPFKISDLACSASDPTNSSICLTTPQLAAAEAIYTGPKDTRSGKQIYPGFSIGSEIGWSNQEGPLSTAFSIPILQNLVYDDLDYNASTFNFGSNVDDVVTNASPLIDEISPDLTAFQEAGAKMLVTQGWADMLNAATWPMEYLQKLEAFNGGDISEFFGLYMIPDGGHCGTNPGYLNAPGTYHVVDALVAWVETGEKPGYVLTMGALDGSDRSRKLCAWPAMAKHIGGHSNSYTSFECE